MEEIVVTPYNNNNQADFEAGPGFITFGSKPFIIDEAYRREALLALKTNQKIRENSDPFISFTGALTRGSVGVTGEVFDVGFSANVGLNENDIIGFRDNQATFLGTNEKGETSYRGGFELEVAGFGFGEQIETSERMTINNWSDLNGTATFKTSLPVVSFLNKYDMQTGKKQSSTQFNLLNFKAALYIGVEASISINPQNIIVVAPMRQHLVSESTQIRVFYPGFKIKK